MILTYFSRYLAATIVSLACLSQAGDKDWKRLFDGESLDGWSCVQSGLFVIEDGAIVAKNTEEDPIPDNRFLVWQGEKPGDFELKLEFKIEGPPRANSGIQFRGSIDETGHVIGYQADIDRAGQWLGTLYDEHTGRKVLARRGEKTVIDSAGNRTATNHSDAEELLAKVDLDSWNEYHIIARGNRLVLKINGVLMSEVLDHEDGEFDARGILALQIHKGPPMTIRFRDIRLKQ